MKNILLTCFIIFISYCSNYSQIPDTAWTQTFGGPLADVGNSVKQTTDGGFIIAATTSSFGAGGQDIWLIKTDENGDTLWTKTFGGIGNDRAANVVQSNDNGYAIFGTTNSFGNGGDDFLLWKTDSLGSTEWYNTYGTNLNEIAREGQKTLDEGYIIVGYFQYNQIIRGWAIKVDNFGNYAWGKILLRSNSDLWPSSVAQTIDSSYFVGCSWGHQYLNGYRIDWIGYKLSPIGDSLFYKEYTNVGYDLLNSVRNTSDGNLILGGSTASENIWLLKTTPGGGIIWSSIIPIPGSWLEFRLTSLEIDDDGFIMTGKKYDANIHLYKTNNSGILQWEKFINTPAYDRAYSVCATSDNGYIVTGETEQLGAGGRDIWLLKFKYNPTPEIQVSKDSLYLTYDDTSSTSRDSLVIYNTGNAPLNVDTIYSTNVSGFILDIVLKDTTIRSSVTWRNSYYNPFELEPNDSAKLVFTYPLWIPKSFNIAETWSDTIIILNNSTNNGSLAIPTVIDFPLGISNETNDLPLKFSLHQNYPNPFNPITKIKFTIPTPPSSSPLVKGRNEVGFVSLKVYDILGNEIATLVNKEKLPGEYEVEFNGAELPSGIYFYQLRVGGPEINSPKGQAGQEFIETKKMILLK